MKYLSDDVINALRQNKVIKKEEVVMKEGDLFVAFDGGGAKDYQKNVYNL